MPNLAALYVVTTKKSIHAGIDTPKSIGFAKVDTRLDPRLRHCPKPLTPRKCVPIGVRTPNFDRPAAGEHKLQRKVWRDGVQPVEIGGQPRPLNQIGLYVQECLLGYLTLGGYCVLIVLCVVWCRLNCRLVLFVESGLARARGRAQFVGQTDTRTRNRRLVRLSARE